MVGSRTPHVAKQFAHDPVFSFKKNVEDSRKGLG
jgi:hypothetical protein